MLSFKLFPAAHSFLTSSPFSMLCERSMQNIKRDWLLMFYWHILSPGISEANLNKLKYVKSPRGEME